MPESASAASSTGIQAPGGSVNVNSISVYVIVIIALAVMLFIFRRKKGEEAPAAVEVNTARASRPAHRAARVKAERSRPAAADFFSGRALARLPRESAAG
jgi:hypothetical protein